MSDYLKHTHSGRIYQIMKDHGPDHPYLWSPWEYAVRTPGPTRWDRFFRPTEKPEVMPTHYNISIQAEIAWEDRKLRGDQPIVVKAPTVQRPQKQKSRVARSPQPKEGYTIQDLAQEVGCTPGQARGILRKSKLQKPSGGWKWSSPEEAELYRKAVKKGLK